MGMHYTQRTWEIQNLFNLELVRKVVTINRERKSALFILIIN